MFGPAKNVFLAAFSGSEMVQILVDISLKLYAFVFSRFLWPIVSLRKAIRCPSPKWGRGVPKGGAMARG